MKKGMVFALVAAIAAGAGGAYYGLYGRNLLNGSSSGRVSSTSEDAVYVTSVSLIAGLGTGTGVIQRYSGEVIPQETWDSKADSERTIKETYVSVGDYVSEGDKLYSYDISEEEDKIAQDEIDIERSRNEISSSEATIANLEKQLANASADDKPSYENQILSEQNSIKQAEYDISSKELEIESLKEGLENADVVSKIDGVVKSINDGNSSSSSDNSSDAYITIMATGDYRVEGTVNEQNIQNIYEGAAVICYSRVDSSLYWLGTVTEIKRDSGTSSSSSSYSSDSDSTSSTNYPFYIELENSEDLLLGQHLYIELNEGQLYTKDGIWIPDYYITQEEDGTAWVWAASDNNQLEKRSVELGEYDEDLLTYEILSGLTAEDYITTPDDTYEEGDPLVYSDSTDMSDDTDDDSIYDEDGDEYYYYDDGSLDLDEDEDLEDYSAYDWDDEDEDGSVYVIDASEIDWGEDDDDEDENDEDNAITVDDEDEE